MTKKKEEVASKKNLKPVIVRAYSGVFFGYLSYKDGDTVFLDDCRQIWSWGSAGMSQLVQTCGDIAVMGLGSDSKVSMTVSKAIIEKVGAVFFATDEAADIVAYQGWGSR